MSRIVTSSRHRCLSVAGVFYYILISIANLVCLDLISIFFEGSSSAIVQVNGIFYLQSVLGYVVLAARLIYNYHRPRQSISAICIPLSVMLSPVLACRLILDLRERGSETVQSTGTIAFTAGATSSKSNPGSPFSGLGFGFGTQGRGNSKGIVRTQGVVLSTIGSIPPDALGSSSNLELEEMQFRKADLEAGMYGGTVRLGSSVSGIRVDVEKTTM